MADFISQFTGTQIDNGIDRALNPDATPTQGSAALIESGGVFAAINTAALSSAPAILNTASGAVCSFPDGSASPMASVIAEIVANQDAPILPAGYWQLDYIESSGTQYIDTGYAVSVENMRYVGKFNFSAINATMTWFGHQRGSIRSGQFYGPRGRVYAGSSNAIMEIGVLATDTDYSVDLTVDNGNATLIANGVTQTATYEGTIIEATRPIYLFGLNGGSGMIYPISGKCYYFKMYQGTTLVRDFVPCIRQADGVLGMYDLVGGAFYANAGTGDFIAGPPTFRPITGYTGANVTRAGRNMLNEASLAVYTNWSNTLFPYGSYPTNSNSRGITLPVKAGATYMLSFGISADSFPTYLYLCRGQGQTSERLKVFTNTSFVDDTFSFTAEEGWLYYIRLGSMSTQSNFETNWAKVAWSQMELGSTAHAHEAYNGTAYTADWSAHGEVFFGTADVVSGEGVDAGGKWQGAADTAYGTYTTGGGVHTANVHGIGMASGDSLLMCEQAVVIPAQSGASAFAGAAVATGATFVIGKNSSTDYLYFYHKDATDTTDLVNKLHSILPTVIYTKATPTAFTFAGQKVASLLGQNNVWNDVGGDTSATHRADTKLYIQSLLGA